MKNNLHKILVLTFAVISIGTFLLFPAPAAAILESGAAAVDMLGQIDLNGDPVYTKRGVHNRPSPFGGGFSGVAIDAVGHRMFALNYNESRVLVFNLDSNNNLVDYAADAVIGQNDFYSETAAATQAKLNYPRGLGYDPVRNYLYVADTSNHRVLVFDVNTVENGENAINVIGQPDFTSTGFTVTTSSLKAPRGVFATSNTLYVADSGNHRVLVYDITTIENGEAAIYVLGQPNFTTVSAATTIAKLSSPYAVHVSGNTMYVADTGNKRVLIFDIATITNGENAVHVLGQALFTTKTAGVTSSTFQNPYDVWVDNNILYVADNSNHRVLLYDVTEITDGEPAIHVLGQADFTSNVTGTAPNRLNEARTVTVSGDTLYVTDWNGCRVLMFDISTVTDDEEAFNLVGQVESATVPNFYKGLSANGPNREGLYYPANLTIDKVGLRLFVSDSYNHRILVYNLNSDFTLVDRLPDAVLGQATYFTYASGLTASTMNRPRGLAFEDNMLYVSDNVNNRVLVFDVTTIANGEEAVHVLGQPDFTTNTARTAAGGFSGPYGLYVEDHNLYVADQANNRIVVFNTNNIEDGQSAINVFGQPDFLTSATGTSAYNLYNPRDVTIKDNWLFVADGTNNRVLVFDLNTSAMGGEASYVLGQDDFVTSAIGAEPLADQLAIPVGLDISNDLLFVAEFNGRRVVAFDISSITNGEEAVYVLGQPDFYTLSTAVDNATFARIYDVAVAGNYLFVPEFDYNRVMIFDITTIPLAPSSITTSTVTATGVTLSWADNSNNETGFTVDISTDGATYTNLGSTVSTSTYSYTGLTPNTQYWFRVAATNSAGTSSYVTTTLGTYTLATAPSSVTAVADTDKAITVAWSGGTAASYYASYSGASSGWTTSSSYQFANLTCNTSYTFTVKAKNAIDQETSGVSVTQTTKSCPGSGSAPPPAGVGSGGTDISVGMNQTGNIGEIPVTGINYLTYINSVAAFTAPVSGASQPAMHHLTVKDLDLLNKVVTILIQSEPKLVSLKLGQNTLVDLDNDAIPDVEIVFANLWVNRAEFTIKAIEKKPVSVSQPVVIKPVELGYVFKRDLSSGMTGEDVKALQQFLNSRGYVLAKSGPGSVGNETNKFGALTRLALAKFQRDNGIVPAIGYFGAITRRLVNDL